MDNASVQAQIEQFAATIQPGRDTPADADRQFAAARELAPTLGLDYWEFIERVSDAQIAAMSRARSVREVFGSP